MKNEKARMPHCTVAVKKANGDVWHFVEVEQGTPSVTVAKETLIEIGPNRYSDYAHSIYWEAFVEKLNLMEAIYERTGTVY